METSRSPFAIWITGPPASGKSTLTAALVRQLHELGVEVAVLESDVMRKKFSEHPSYDEQDREYFYRSMAFIGQVLTERGISVIFDATANRRAYRDRARRHIANFFEVFVECPFDICVQRDPKGIYRKAHEGQANNVPGILVPYEPPEKPDLVVRGDSENPEEAANRVVNLLTLKGLLA